MSHQKLDAATPPTQHVFTPRVVVRPHIAGQLVVCGTCGRLSHQRLGVREKP